MIIFKKIRQSQIFINIYKYLLYSIGEIALIFIGITLAIYFNNQKERKDYLSEESSILKQMVFDLDRDLYLLNFIKNECENITARDTFLLSGKLEGTPVRVLTHHYLRYSVPSVDFHFESFEKINKLNIGIINVDTIHSFIKEYYSGLKNLDNQCEEDLIQTRKAEDEFMITNDIGLPFDNNLGDTILLKKSYTQLLSSNKHRNIMIRNIDYKRYILGSAGSAIKLNEDLKNKIKIYLGK